MFLVLLAQAVPVPPKPVEIDFDQVEVTAPVDGPSIDLIRERRAAPVSPRLKLRTDFNQEMVESANEVR